MTLKLSRYFYLLIVKSAGCYFQIVFFLSDGTVQPHLFLYPQCGRSGLRMSKKGETSTLITNHGYY